MARQREIKAIKERDNLLRKVRHSYEKSWKTALKMIIILGVIDLVLVPLLITLLRYTSSVDIRFHRSHNLLWYYSGGQLHVWHIPSKHRRN
jgi:hypothetical protein